MSEAPPKLTDEQRERLRGLAESATRMMVYDRATAIETALARLDYLGAENERLRERLQIIETSTGDQKG